MKEKKPNPLLQKIFDLMRSQKVTLKDMAKVLGDITESGASSVLNGDSPLKSEYLPGVAKLLGKKVWELFSDYDAGEIGPLSEEEKLLISEYRRIPLNGNREIIKKTIKAFTKQ